MNKSSTLQALEGAVQELVTKLAFHRSVQRTFEDADVITKDQDRVRVAKKMLRLYVHFTPLIEQYIPENNG